MKTLDTFEFRGGHGGASKYPWETLLSGRIYQLTQGEDFDCGVITIASLYRTRAKRAGLVPYVSVDKKAGTVTVQAVDAEGNGETPAPGTPTGKKGRKGRKGKAAEELPVAEPVSE